MTNLDVLRAGLGWVFSPSGPPSSNQRVLFAALYFSVDPSTGECSPSRSDLSDLSGLHPNTVSRTIPELVVGHFLEVEKRPGRRDAYLLTVTSVVTVDPRHPNQGGDGTPSTLTREVTVDPDHPTHRGDGSRVTLTAEVTVDQNDPNQGGDGSALTVTREVTVGVGTVSVQTDQKGSSDPDPRSEEDHDPGGRGDPGEREPISTSIPSEPAPAVRSLPTPAQPTSFLQPLAPVPPKVSPARARKGGHEDIPEAELLPAEREVFDAILAGEHVSRITPQPARTARLLVGMIAASKREVEGAYQVVLADEWLSRGKRRTNGKAFLVNFVKNAIERAPLLPTSRPSPASPVLSEREILRAKLGAMKPADLHPPEIRAAVEKATREAFGGDGKSLVLPTDPVELAAMVEKARANVGKAARRAPRLEPGAPVPPPMPRADGLPHERFGGWLPPTDPADPYNVPARQLFETKSQVEARLAASAHRPGGDPR